MNTLIIILTIAGYIVGVSTIAWNFEQVEIALTSTAFNLSGLQKNDVVLNLSDGTKMIVKNVSSSNLIELTTPRREFIKKLFLSAVIVFIAAIALYFVWSY